MKVSQNVYEVVLVFSLCIELSGSFHVLRSSQGFARSTGWGTGWQPKFASVENEAAVTKRRRIELCMTSSSKEDEAESSASDADDSNKKSKSKYGEVDYSNIELEFVDYNDPNYVVDQGLIEGEEVYAAEKQQQEEDEAVLESMREERRKRNDEFQFETYFRDAWGKGAEYRGEWTTYGTSTFIDGVAGAAADQAEAQASLMLPPRLLKASKITRVVSQANKIVVDEDAEWRGDRQRIVHQEYQVVNESKEPTLSKSMDTDTDSGFGRHQQEEAQTKNYQYNQNDDDTKQQLQNDKNDTRRLIDVRYWPEEMKSMDFRGPQGNMCVGNAYSVCEAISLYDDDTDANHDNGPFKELRAEIGLHGEELRMRVKFEYKTLPTTTSSSSTTSPPPLRLSTITVCRERQGEWPSSTKGRDVALFGTSAIGAHGGLYDPPPVGDDDRAARYMLLDLEGGASVLFPHAIDQEDIPESTPSSSGVGWVLSLDWTPGNIRFQVDRKFHNGSKLKGLRTLELSEVQATEADRYRPRSGPVNMRQ